MVSVIGFIILPLTVLALFGYTFEGNIVTHGYSRLFFLQAILLIGLIYGINSERKREVGKKYSFDSIDFYNFIALLIGAYLSFVFNNYLKWVLWLPQPWLGSCLP